MAGRGDHVAVLGAGIQGSCAALALANIGYRVTLVDAAEDCMLRASLRNEGKIHLGLVYANDPSHRTPDLMLDAALAFGDVLETQVGRVLPWDALRSRPFTYLVLRDSLLEPVDIRAAFHRLDMALRARDARRYLGREIDHVWFPDVETPLPAWCDPCHVRAAIRTNEVALDTAGLRSVVADALADHDSIRTWYGHRVREVRRTVSGFHVDGVRDDGSVWRHDAAVVVNCLWHERLSLDAALGIQPTRPWVHRLKHRVLGRLPEHAHDIPSLTMVLGRFGDVVVNAGRPTYLSWYPACMSGWDTSLAPPSDWDAPCAGRTEAGMAATIAEATVDALASIVPSIAGFEVATVDAGTIVAWGETDIGDPSSDLHSRHDIGVHEHDGWFSIDTGKLTTGPLFAARLADLVGGRG